MSIDLTNLYISESFQKLVQITGSTNTLSDGVGNLLTLVTAPTFSGYFYGSGAGLTNLTASIVNISGTYWTSSADYIERQSDVQVTGSLYISGMIYGDGSQLSNLTASSWTTENDNSITRNSDVKVTGSLYVSGSDSVVKVTGSVQATSGSFEYLEIYGDTLNINSINVANTASIEYLNVDTHISMSPGGTVDGVDISAFSSSVASEINSLSLTLPANVVSSSNQIASEISGAFYVDSSSLAGRITTNETDIAALDIPTASEISGAFTADSSSFELRVTTLETATSESYADFAESSSYAISASSALWSNVAETALDLDVSGFDNNALFYKGGGGLTTDSDLTWSGTQFDIGGSGGLNLFSSIVQTQATNLRIQALNNDLEFFAGSGANNKFVFLLGSASNKKMEITPTHISGAANMTASFAYLEAGNVSASSYYGDGSNLTGISSVSSTAISGAFDEISSSFENRITLITGSFWTGSADGSINRAGNVNIEGNISASATSTGSFGVGYFENRVGINVSGSNINSRLHINSTETGSSVFLVEGQNGILFQIFDELSGSLFAVSDITGFPIVEVFEDDKIVMGKYGQNTLVVTGSQIGIGTDTPQPSSVLDIVGDTYITGTLHATAKSFDILHPTEKGKRLRYGALEGPEYGVYYRGEASSSYIPLPDYWNGLVDAKTITVQLTPVGKYQRLYVYSGSSQCIIVRSEDTSLHYYYTVYGERKDINKLVTEY